MKALLYLSGVVLVVVCASWAYRVNYETREARGRVAELRAEIARGREALGMLRAEWAYLNRPDRLRALIETRGARLELAALVPEQFGAATMIAYPPEPAIAPLERAGPHAEARGAPDGKDPR